MDLDSVMELVQAGQEFKPQAQEIVDLLLSYSPEIKQVMESCVDGVANLKIRMVSNFEKAGFTKDQAILLSCDSFQSVQNRLNKQEK